MYRGDTHKLANMEAPSPQYVVSPPPYEETIQPSRGYPSQQISVPFQHQQSNYTPYRPHAYPHPSDDQPPHLSQPQQWSSQSAYTHYTSTQKEPQDQWQTAPHIASSSGQSCLPPSQPDTQHRSSKQRPCVIPQIMSVVGGEYMSPFVRTRAPELEQQYGLSFSELLAFINGLNEAFMANPALQVTDAIGKIVGFVPLQTTQIVGASLNVATSIGTAGVSIVRTKRYMKKANETLFKPKGLHAQICKTEQMLTQIGMEGDTVVFAKSQFQAMIGSAQAQEPSGNAIARRMESLGDRVMKLLFDDIAAPVSPHNWAKKLGSYAAQHAEKKQLKELEKKQTKAHEKAAKAEQKLAKAEQKHGGDDGQLDKIMRDMEGVQSQIQYLDPTDRRYEKHLKELQREHREFERKIKQLDAQRSRKTERMEKSTRKRDAKNAKRDFKEAKKIKKIYWILITTEEESPQGDDDWASDDSTKESINGDMTR